MEEEANPVHCVMLQPFSLQCWTTSWTTIEGSCSWSLNPAVDSIGTIPFKYFREIQKFECLNVCICNCAHLGFINETLNFDCRVCACKKIVRPGKGLEALCYTSENYQFFTSLLHVFAS